MSSPSSAAAAARRLGAIVLALGLLLIAGTGTASAHATLVTSDPADGTSLGVTPPVIRLVFSEPVAVSLVTVMLVDDTGATVGGTPVVADPSDPGAAVIVLPRLAPGAYHLTWRAVDSEDLHVTTGTLVFGVAAAAPAPVSAPVVVPDTAEVIARWLDMVALSIAAGSLAVLAFALPRPPAPAGRGGPPPSPAAPSDMHAAARRRLLVAGLAGALCGLVTSSALLQAQAAGSGASIGAVLATGYGAPWAMRLVAVMALAVVVATRLRWHADGRVATIASIGLVAAIAAIGTSMGHATAGDPAGRPVRLAALTLHVVAAWSWAGGLAALVVVVLPLRHVPGGRSLSRATLRRFWLVATPALALAAVSGLYLSGQLIATPAALVGTLYGQALILKIVVAGGAATLGLLNATALHRSLAAALERARLPTLHLAGQAWLPRRIVLECAGATVVVLAASALAASPPARGPAWDPAPTATGPAAITVPADDLLVVLAVRPNRPGPNFVDVTVLQTRKPAPAPIGQVTIALADTAGKAADAAPAAPLGGGRYQLPAGLMTAPGRWNVTVAVHRQGLPDARVAVPWEVLPATAGAGARADGIGGMPLAPLTTVSATLLAVVLGSVTLLGVGRALTRRRTGSGSAGSSTPSPHPALPKRSPS